MSDQILKAATNGEDAYRREIRVWMRQVLATKRFSAEGWARQAHMAGTTVRRFLNGGPDAPTPSLDTIHALSLVAGYGPNLSFTPMRTKPKAATCEVPLLTPDLAMRLVSRAAYQEAYAEMIQMPKTLVDPGGCSALAYATTVEHSSVNQLGVLPQDIVIVEPVWSVAPKANDMVLIDDLSQVMVMTYLAPYAMPRSTDPTYDPRDLDDIALLGVVVELKRRVLRR